MREKYIQEVNEEFAKLPENTQHIEEEWKYFKNTIIQTAENICGYKNHKGRKPKITAWWTDEVKKATKDKIQEMGNKQNK